MNPDHTSDPTLGPAPAAFAEPLPPVVRHPRGPADPGSRTAAVIAWVLGLLLVATVVWDNQWGGQSATPVPLPDIKVVAPDALDPVTMGSKMMVKVKGMGLPMTASDRAMMMKNIDGSVHTPLDRFRAAIAAAELDSPEAALKRLDELEALPEDPKAPGLHTDIVVYRQILDGDSADLTQEQRDTFRDRHGWFARLALSYGIPDTDPARAPLLAGGFRFFLGCAFAGLIFFTWFVGGVTAFIIACIRISQRGFPRRFLAPSPGGSVFLESAAFFVAAFLLFKIVTHFIIDAASPPTPEWAVAFQLCSQWVLLTVPLYPLLRRVGWPRLKESLGLHRGQGVGREIRAGIAGYFAGLPILAVAMTITLIVVLVRSRLGGEDAEPPSNPIAELLGRAGLLEIILLFSLATVWAPLVEESTFRGAFFRHLRSRLPLLPAAAISALIFGLMHGYDLVLLLPVITLGFNFALMREWRGSLIGPITAHALHNGTLLLVLAAVFAPLMD